jgi:molecular chaperone GrpE
MDTRDDNLNPNRPGGDDAARARASRDSGSQDSEPGAMGSLSLQDQLDAARGERDANYDRFLRAQAELENYRKRVSREAEENSRYEWLPVARELLPALDNLRRAIAAGETTNNTEELLRGVQMVAAQIEEALARHSIVPIEAVGQPFDPNMHEAVQQIPSAEHPPMTVLQDVERGYKLHDRVVRPTKVIVSAAPQGG